MVAVLKKISVSRSASDPISPVVQRSQLGHEIVMLDTFVVVGTTFS